MTDTPQPGAAEATLPVGIDRFANSSIPRSFSALKFLRSPNATLLAGGLLLPNLLSLATLSSLVDIGLPPRTGAIFLYATLAICARRIPFAATALLFLAVLAFDMVRTLSLMFGLAPSELMAALDHARRINFFSSPLYVTLIGAVATTTIAAFYFLSQRTKLMQGNIYVLFGTALAFAPLDYVTNVSAHYQFGSMFGRDKPVASAADVSGFNAVAGANGRNVVIVIVESLGYMTRPDGARAHRRAALRPANCAEICRDIRQQRPTTARRPRAKCANCATRARSMPITQANTAIPACPNCCTGAATSRSRCTDFPAACLGGSSGIRVSASTRRYSATSW